MFKRKPKYPQLYPEDFSADLDSKLDWILKSNISVVVGILPELDSEYLRLKSDLMRLINEEKHRVQT